MREPERPQDRGTGSRGDERSESTLSRSGPRAGPERARSARRRSILHAALLGIHRGQPPTRATHSAPKAPPALIERRGGGGRRQAPDVGEVFLPHEEYIASG